MALQRKSAVKKDFIRIILTKMMNTTNEENNKKDIDRLFQKYIDDLPKTDESDINDDVVINNILDNNAVEQTKSDDTSHSRPIDKISFFNRYIYNGIKFLKPAKIAFSMSLLLILSYLTYNFYPFEQADEEVEQTAGKSTTSDNDNDSVIKIDKSVNKEMITEKVQADSTEKNINTSEKDIAAKTEFDTIFVQDILLAYNDRSSDSSNTAINTKTSFAFEIISSILNNHGISIKDRLTSGLMTDWFINQENNRQQRLFFKVNKKDNKIEIEIIETSLREIKSPEVKLQMIIKEIDGEIYTAMKLLE